jgi:hypothetical protein
MLQIYLIQEGYLALGSFVVFHVVGMLLNKHQSKREDRFSPFKSWTWNEPPGNFDRYSTWTYAWERYSLS